MPRAAAARMGTQATGRGSGNAFRRPARSTNGAHVCASVWVYVCLYALMGLWVVHPSDENPRGGGGARAARSLDVPVEGDDIKKVRAGSSGRAYCGRVARATPPRARALLRGDPRITSP